MAFCDDSVLHGPVLKVDILPLQRKQFAHSQPRADIQQYEGPFSEGQCVALGLQVSPRYTSLFA
jgi:hypothetical protein